MSENRPKEDTVEAAIAETARAASPPSLTAEPSLEELFRQHHQQVLRIAWRITGDPDDAEDVLQTVFLRVARRREELDPTQNLAGYLSRAATHAALDLLRARKRSRSVPLEDSPASPSPTPSPERRPLDRELRQWLRQGLAQLSPQAAAVFALRYFEGHANRDIAGMLGMSPTAVAVTLHRVRGRLQEELAPLAGGSR
jgi:RNA polymerase sigma-70 factor (ECF subfamily)